MLITKKDLIDYSKLVSVSKEAIKAVDSAENSCQLAEASRKPIMSKIHFLEDCVERMREAEKNESDFLKLLLTKI